jgi:hypothetical protein
LPYLPTWQATKMYFVSKKLTSISQTSFPYLIIWKHNVTAW